MKIVILSILLFNLIQIQAQSTITADSLYATGDYTKAINAYAKEGTPKAGLQIARAYNAKGNFDKAIAQYEAVVEKTPALEIARFELGKLYLKKKQFDDARKRFTGLVAANKTNPEYLYHQGEAFRELGELPSSLVAYKKAIAIDSTHLRSLFQLAKFFVVSQENLQALPYIEQGLEYYPNDVSLLNLQALAHYNNNAYEQSILPFEKLLSLGEKKEHIYLKLADAYAKEWEFEKSKHTYRTLLQDDDENHEAYFGLGGVYAKTKMLDSAVINYKKAIAVQDPELDREYIALAEIARKQKDLKTALEYYKLAFSENQESMFVYYNVCTVADQYYQDPKVRLSYYENFEKKFDKKHRYYSETVAKRIRELKEEIHFAGN